METRGQSAISVSAAMALAKGALESVSVKIIGEISELSNKPGYKAVYFTVKDQSASLPCMMWNNRYTASGIQLSIGALIEITGKFSLYAAKGRMNFDVTSISLAGEGNLRLQVANLAKKLDAEGLFSVERKRPLPAYPQKIGLVTSPRGAAVHDVLRTLRRRFPLAKVLLAGVPVEGVDAPRHLIEALSCVVDAGAEMVLLVRGGGSFEDLMPFNDEMLARNIASLPIPVVTGIGHEPDTSIADLVADVRASTPTAAAEAVSISSDEIRTSLNLLMNKMLVSEKRLIRDSQSKVDLVAANTIFKDPMRLFEDEAQSIDDLSYRLSKSLGEGLNRRKDTLNYLKISMQKSLPYLTSRYSALLGEYSRRMLHSGKTMGDKFRNSVSYSASRLNDLSPLQVIARGYSLIEDQDKNIVSSIGQVAKGDKIDVLVKDGYIHCNVSDVDMVELTFSSMEDENE